MTDDPESIDKSSRKTGRSSPPKHTRFRKGTSGNPKGRPKGAKNLSTYIMEAAHHRVTATIDGKPRKIANVHATAMQLATKAASGKESAIKTYLDWIDKFETRAQAARPVQFPLGEADIEVIRAIYERMKQCELDETEES